MKSPFFAAFMLLQLFCMPLMASDTKKIKAYLMLAEFTDPSLGNYIESYLSISAKSVIYKPNQNGKYQSSIGVNILFSKNDSIYAYGKYNLLSPEYDDVNDIKLDFTDVQRFFLKPGEYTFELNIIDNNNPGQPFTYSQIVSSQLNISKPCMSTIELVDSYTKSDATNNRTKNRFEIIPYISSYYPEALNEITFYTEIYGLTRDIAQDESVIVNAYLEGFESGTHMTDFFRFQKVKSANIIPFLSSLNIKSLPSGNYNLVIEVRDKENKLIVEQKTFIQRNNPSFISTPETLTALNIANTFVEKIHTDSLNQFIKYLYPISSRLEVEYANNVVANTNILAKQQYFLSFWQKRNNLQPNTAWEEYYLNVLEANKLFKTQTRKGYATDRGRVYLQYGKPDSRLIYDREPSLYPYELWQYYKIDNFSNKRFVFVNTDLVSNNYFLIHSDAIGEVRDDRWQTRLNKRNNWYKSFDEEKANDQFGSFLRDAYDISR
ncbi:MAG: GWxTD domain-containing protein [Bacteroidia bacterium]|nr:GWxTD domain-containing protein [Bacteroidia bacterium]MCZ2247990.1 GWxTD domain-containing protein [Bacteroidia bacterium]